MGILKNVIKALLEIDPYEIEVHLRNGNKLKFNSEAAFIHWLMNFNVIWIAQLEFKYSDGVKVEIEDLDWDKDEDDDD